MGPITNVLGIDVSESAGDGTTMPWQQIAQRGTQIIVIVVFSGLVQLHPEDDVYTNTREFRAS